jgi:hypothetical protein
VPELLAEHLPGCAVLLALLGAGGPGRDWDTLSLQIPCLLLTTGWRERSWEGPPWSFVKLPAGPFSRQVALETSLLRRAGVFRRTDAAHFQLSLRGDALACHVRAVLQESAAPFLADIEAVGELPSRQLHLRLEGLVFRGLVPGRPVAYRRLPWGITLTQPLPAGSVLRSLSLPRSFLQELAALLDLLDGIPEILERERGA